MGIGKIYAYFSSAIPYNIPEAYKLNCLIVLSFSKILSQVFLAYDLHSCHLVSTGQGRKETGGH